MNMRLVINLMGKALVLLGLFMILPLLWALYDQGPDRAAFIISILITLSSGLLITWLVPGDGEIRYRESFVIVTVGWVLASFFGSLPYLLSGVCTSFPDAFFETVSGFTTTGASIFTDVEILPRGIIFWRSLTHWLGGMGIIVFLVALLSNLGAGANRIFQAEAPGAVTSKIMPRISETARILWITYLVMTIIETGLLWYFGMPLFDALCHTFGTVATGGFGIKNQSIGAYHQASIQWVITVFMFLSGANFALYYQALRGRSLKVFWRNEGFRLYTAIVLLAALVVAINTHHLFSGEELIRTSLFQVVSIITTTGYATADFNLWPYTAQAVLVTLMFIGGCSGSTSGSIKVERILLLLKQGVVEIRRMIHPRIVLSSKIEGNHISLELVSNVQQFFFLYITIFVISGIIITAMGVDLVSGFTAVAATLGNVGPGLGEVGPAGNFAHIASMGKILLSVLMLLGRLEIYTVFVLFSARLRR
ncbi:MAG: TrkH family potassium uptake protein [Thermacetogeniaceae bacterium]|jgi:trk system potassium uptake protein TrkH